MTNETEHPFDKVRDGSLTATIWKNEREKAVIYSVEFDRAYTDSEGHIQNARSFSGSQLLRISRLAQKAYDVIQEAKAADRENAEQEAA